MNLTFIKVNLIIFEIVAISTTILSLFGLSYYTFFYQMRSGIKHRKMAKVAHVSYYVKEQKNVFSNVAITLNKPSNNYNSDNDGYILYNKNQDATEEKIIEQINAMNPYNIFLFKNKQTANQFKSYLENIVGKSSNAINTILLLLSILFFTFVKIGLAKTSWKQIKEIKSNKQEVSQSDDILDDLSLDIAEKGLLLGKGGKKKTFYYNPVLSLLNPKNIFNYIVFQLTVIIILPILYPTFSDLKINVYYGFRPNMFNSVYYSRSYFGQRDFQPNANPTFVVNGIQNITGLYNFTSHERIEDAINSHASFNPYFTNLAFLAISVWVAQYFKPFDTGKMVIRDRLKMTKWKIFKKIFVIAVLFSAWGFLFGIGLLNAGDYIFLFHCLVFMDVRKLLDPKITVTICVFYYHIFFYALMIIYTIQMKIKNRNFENSKKNNSELNKTFTSESLNS